MIREFIHAWPLFATSWITGWLVAATLSLIGVVVIARNQVFVGAALSQASTLGIALAMWIGALGGEAGQAMAESDSFLTAVAVVVAVIGALATARSSGPGHESREGMMGWLFLLGAAGSIVVVSRSPHGMEEVRRLFESSIIGATKADVAAFSVAAVATAAAITWQWRAILLWIMDPATAQASGVRARRMETVSAIWLGLGVGLAIRASGTLYTFGCLALPALIAKSLCREVRTMFFVAPLVAVAAGVIGFVVANYYDFPPAQMATCLSALALPLSWTRRKFRRL